MERKKKTVSEDEAFEKLSRLCAASEYCIHDMKRKMSYWDMPEGAREKVINRLLADKFIDEARYARAFTHDKFAFNNWGEMKIEMELRRRGISQKDIDDAKDEIQEDESLERLRTLIEAKRPSVKGRSEYEIRAKLYRFAYSKGFSTDQIIEVIGDIY